MAPHSKSWFGRFAQWAACHVGKPGAFCGAAALVVGWAAAGPIFGFSNTWQLFINTCTTIVTFLMVFLIQNSQNRDSTALQLKLDELIRATKEANDELLDLEEMEEVELDRMRAKYEAMAERARGARKNRRRAQTPAAM